MAHRSKKLEPRNTNTKDSGSILTTNFKFYHRIWYNFQAISATSKAFNENEHAVRKRDYGSGYSDVECCGFSPISSRT